MSAFPQQMATVYAQISSKVCILCVEQPGTCDILSTYRLSTQGMSIPLILVCQIPCLCRNAYMFLSEWSLLALHLMGSHIHQLHPHTCQRKKTQKYFDCKMVLLGYCQYFGTWENANLPCKNQNPTEIQQNPL